MYRLLYSQHYHVSRTHHQGSSGYHCWHTTSTRSYRGRFHHCCLRQTIAINPSYFSIINHSDFYFAFFVVFISALSIANILMNGHLIYVNFQCLLNSYFSFIFLIHLLRFSLKGRKSLYKRQKRRDQQCQ